MNKKIALICITTNTKFLQKYINHYIHTLKFDKIIFIDLFNSRLNNLYDDNNQIIIYNVNELLDINDYVYNKSFLQDHGFKENNWIILQTDIYNEIIKRHINEFDWMAFFDNDEYLEINDLKFTIKDYINNPKIYNYDCILVKWNIYFNKSFFGDNSFDINDSNQILIENEHAYKSIINCKTNLNNYKFYFNFNPHLCMKTFNNYTYLLNYCDSNGDNINYYDSNGVIDATQINNSEQLLMINHFRYDPYITYINKILHGNYEYNKDITNNIEALKRCSNLWIELYEKYVHTL